MRRRMFVAGVVLLSLGIGGTFMLRPAPAAPFDFIGGQRVKSEEGWPTATNPWKSYIRDYRRDYYVFSAPIPEIEAEADEELRREGYDRRGDSLVWLSRTPEGIFRVEILKHGLPKIPSAYTTVNGSIIVVVWRKPTFFERLFG